MRYKNRIICPKLISIHIYLVYFNSRKQKMMQFHLEFQEKCPCLLRQLFRHSEFSI